VFILLHFCLLFFKFLDPPRELSQGAGAHPLGRRQHTTSPCAGRAGALTVRLMHGVAWGIVRWRCVLMYGFICRSVGDIDVKLLIERAWLRKCLDRAQRHAAGIQASITKPKKVCKLYQATCHANMFSLVW
jgi:hypothetical protein